MKLRGKWVVALVSLWAAVIAQTGCATVRGTAPVNIDQSSPQALARSLHEAAVNDNYAAMLECMEPAYQGLYDEFLVALKGVRQKMDMLVAVVWEKFGYEQAERVRRTWHFPISPFVSIVEDGRVDWKKVRFLHPKDNMAYIWIVDDGRMTLRKIGTRWFIAGDTEGYVPHLNEEMKAGYRHAAPEYQKLIDRIRKSQVTTRDAEETTLGFLAEHVPPGVSPMCGNSICQDRRFLARLMPELERYFHYRNLDVSSLKELARRWAPDITRGFGKKASHQALDDVYESIAELRHYREHFLRLPEDKPAEAGTVDGY